MIQLILINCICIGMDIILIGLEFTNQYVGEASIKPMVYAIKLKLEFTVLNQLMGLSKAGFTEEGTWRGGHSHGNHELKDRTLASADPEAQGPPKKASNWSTAKTLRGSVVNPRTGSVQAEPTELIYKTQDIEVISETGIDLGEPGALPGTNENSVSSSSTAVTAGGEPNSKVKSLMGTTKAYIPHHMPHRTNRESRYERHERHGPVERQPSPSESEKDIFRSSLDTEKGTRSTGGISFQHAMELEEGKL